jgi:hypothetical protein
LLHRLGTEAPERTAGDQVTLNIECAVDGGVDGQKALRCNPWSRDHVTGGSSSGSGAAVAARLVCEADANARQSR